MMLSFVLVCFLGWEVGGRGGCVVGTLVLGSSNEGATALRLPCKLAPVYAANTFVSVCQKCSA